MTNSLKKILAEVNKSVVRDLDGVLVHFKCKFCAKTIVRQDYFKLHLHRQHYLNLSIEKPPKNFMCPFEQCQFSFFTKSELNSHIGNKHTRRTCTVAESVIVGSTRSTAAPIPQATIVEKSPPRSPPNENLDENATIPTAQNKVTLKIIPSQRIVAITGGTPSNAQSRTGHIAASTPTRIKIVALTPPIMVEEIEAVSKFRTPTSNLASNVAVTTAPSTTRLTMCKVNSIGTTSPGTSRIRSQIFQTHQSNQDESPAKVQIVPKQSPLQSIYKHICDQGLQLGSTGQKNLIIGQQELIQIQKHEQKQFPRQIQYSHVQTSKSSIDAQFQFVATTAGNISQHRSQPSNQLIISRPTVKAVTSLIQLSSTVSPISSVSTVSINSPIFDNVTSSSPSIDQSDQIIHQKQVNVVPMQIGGSKSVQTNLIQLSPVQGMQQSIFI